MARWNRHSQRGQVMPMAVVFIMAVILAVWVLYDSGQVATERMRLQNTADNVAYSAATLASRDMNFIAYTNRAMVANQVSIAQLVGLSSWMAMMNQLGHNIDTIGELVEPFYPFGPIVRAITAEIQAATEIGADVTDAFVEATIPIVDAVIGGLSQAQAVYHLGAVAAMADLSADIAAKNDPNATPMLGIAGLSASEPASFSGQWSSLVGDQNDLHAVSDGSNSAVHELKRYREFDQVVVGSRDRFTRRRSYNWPQPWTFVAFPFKLETRKYGGTDLFRTVGDDREYEWSWAAMDTVSTYVSKFICDPFCSWDEIAEVPLGWGAAHALPNKESGDYFQYDGQRRNDNAWGAGAWRNSAAGDLMTGPADGEYLLDHPHHKVGNIGGLRRFYDFRSDEIIDSGPAVIAFYKKDAAYIDSTSGIAEAGGGSFEGELDTASEGSLAEDQISALAKAEAYFARATDLGGWKRGDDKFEHGNLYNPFWQPRLVDPTDAEKLAASTAAGVLTGAAP